MTYSPVFVPKWSASCHFDYLCGDDDNFDYLCADDDNDLDDQHPRHYMMWTSILKSLLRTVWIKHRAGWRRCLIIFRVASLNRIVLLLVCVAEAPIKIHLWLIYLKYIYSGNLEFLQSMGLKLLEVIHTFWSKIVHFFFLK